MKSSRALLLMGLVPVVAIVGCSQPNRLVGTWKIAGIDPSERRDRAVRQMVISDTAIEALVGDSSSKLIVPIKMLNDHQAVMEGPLGVSTSVEVTSSGEIHLSDPDDTFRRVN